MKSRISRLIERYSLIAYVCLAYLITYAAQFGFLYFNPAAPLRPWSLIWGLGVFGPSLSALLVGWLIGGAPEVKRLLSGFARWKVGFGWYFAAAFLFLAPLAITLVYGVLGQPSPGPKPGETLASLAGIVLFTLFSGPLSEELGWRGFALPRLQAKHPAWVSSLLLGVVWTCWHIPLFFISSETQMSIPFPIYLVLVLTLTFYITWLYNNTGGSLIVTVLAHFAFNMTGFLTGPLGLMPPMTFYMTAGPMLGLIVVGVVIAYGPRYLSKKAPSAFPIQPQPSAAAP
jgi:membrane protease YdiL (CAAX protease family)